MSIDDARHIVGWRYDPPYDIYDVVSDDLAEEAKYYADPENGYFSLRADGELVGFACYGAEGQVPGGDYSADMLDVGIGMRPDLTGQGQGNVYAEAVFAFAHEHFDSKALRVTIAEFNKRSQRVVEKVGFTRAEVFTKPASDKRYEIWTRTQ